MLLPQPQRRLIEILAAEQADCGAANGVASAIPFRLRRADRAFELALLLSEDALAVTLLHAADRLGRLVRPAPRAAC